MIQKKMPDFAKEENLNKNGYTFAKINKNLNKKLNSIRKILKNKQDYLLKLNEKKYYKEIIKILESLDSRNYFFSFL